MATKQEKIVVQIVVDATKAGRAMKGVAKDMKRTATASEKMRKSFVKLNSALAIIGGATFFGGMVKDMGRMIDRYKELGGRINLVARESVGLQQAQEDLNGVALRTYTNYEAVANVYSRVGLAMKDLNVSHDQLTTFTEALANSLRLSGASAQEARSSLLQLSQAMASGVLAGDEFRSISENNVALLDQLSKQLGVTRGELKKMAANQELTTEKVFGAMMKASAELKEEVEKLPVTLGRAMNNMHTQWQKYVSDVDKSVGITNILSDAIVAVANNLQILVEVAVTFLAVFAASKIKAIAAAVWGLNGALAASAATMARLYGFAKLAAATIAIVSGYKFGEAVAGAGTSGTNRVNFSKEMGFEELERKAISTGKLVNEQLEAGNKKLAAVYQTDLDRLRLLMSDKNKLIQADLEEAKSWKDEWAKIAEQNKMLEGITATSGVSPTAIEPSGGGGGGGGGGGVSRADSLKQLREEVERINESLNPALALWNEYDRNVRTVEEAFAKGAITASTYAEVMKLLRDDVQSASEALQDNAQELSLWEDMALDAIDSFAAGFADTLVDSLLDAKNGFREFAADFTRQIAKMIAQQMILIALQKLMGAVPGLAPFAGFIGKFDSGGYIPAGSTGIVGERGAELVSGPAKVTGREDTAKMFQQLTDAVNSLQQPSQNVRVINVQEENAEDYLGSDPGERKVMNILRRNRSAVQGLVA